MTGPDPQTRQGPAEEFDPELPAAGPELETAHVLFMDIVGYSKLPMDQQNEALKRLQEIVRETPEFRRAEASQRLIRLPTGDGMALVFFRDPIAPVECAFGVARALARSPEIPLRIGVHSGPVYRVSDINTSLNVAGGGINMAQRVMDCGDAGHILVSKTVADTLSQLSQWSGYVHDLGEVSVKHGVRIHVFNLYNQDAGNAATPEKIRAQSSIATVKPKWKMRAALAGGLALLALGGFEIYRRFGPAPQGNSIAILPFENPDTQTAYLSDGLTEDLINSLGQVPDFTVMSRSAVFSSRKEGGDPAAVGRKLGVSTVLAGKFVPQGEIIQIGVELVSARNNSHVWGTQYTTRLSELSRIRADISQEIAQRVRGKLTPQEKSLLAKRPTENPEAYQLYSLGRFFWNKRTQDSFKKAIEYFEKVIERDPNYAQAYTGLADCYSMQSGVIPPKDTFPKAELAAIKALERDDSLAEAHASLAFIKLYFEWDWIGAEKEYKRAIQLNPNYPSARSNYALYLVVMKRFDEAIAEMRKALQLDPTSAVANTGLGRIFYWAGQYDRAIEQYRRALDIDSTFPQAHTGLGSAYEARSNLTGAIEELQKGLDLLKTKDAGALGELAHVYVLQGRRSEALQLLDQLQKLTERRYVSPYFFAGIHANLGNKEKAFEWLEKGYQDRTFPMIYLHLDPTFKTVRTDSRFQDLVRRVGLPM